ncbi:ARHGB factor, partial [Sakesphorus luctuosus]|nr:ARHGB factor [Sakesphorus luctuosus]
ELFATEGSHLRILRVLDLLFYQRMRKENLLSREELGCPLCPPQGPSCLPPVPDSLFESMKKLREEGPIIKEIGDLMLSRFDGPAKEEIQQVAATFCSYQSIALELIKTKQRKETRFQIFMQEAESNPQCRRLQLKDLIISEMQRLTKYPLLLENIIKVTEAASPEHEKLCRARDQCRDILRVVNEAVKEAENRHRLEGYQKRLDTTSLERTSNPLAAQFKSLDLTSRRMIHEGPLAWRVGKDKTVDLHVLLLEDLLVLLQKQDEKLVLKCHSRTSLGSSDTKQTFSPVLKLNSVLIRSVATDKRALFIICTSELGPQIYELVALTSSEKNTWMELLEEAVQRSTRNATFPPKRRTPEPARAVPAGLGLPDPDVSPVLSHSSRAEPEAEDCSSGELYPLAPGGGTGELGPLAPGGGTDLATSLLPGGAIPALPTPIPDIPTHLPLPTPRGSRSVAEAALEDVEKLRLLILRGLQPRRDVDPEDDVTPTPSVGWDSGLPGQDSSQDSSRDSSQDSNHDPNHDSSRDSIQDPSRDSSREGLRVVRKAQVEGAQEATPLPGSSQSESELREGGGACVDGNYFYLSLPTGPPPGLAQGAQDPPRGAQDPPRGAQGAQDPPRGAQGAQEPPRGAQGAQDPPRGAQDPPRDPPSDGELLLSTIEQLKGKLHRLRALEVAHQQLLRSLGGGDTTSPPGVPAQPPLSPDSSLSRALRSLPG